MDLNHSFTVPASIEDTWKTFEDIESVAGCFPGATVTEVDGSDFKGTCKVKLGPIALVYSGSGTFLEKDESAHRFVIDAKGKDKRGNGTAGAKVTATFAEEGPSETRVEVNTDLAITGKPAQFGRGVIEDISNKLLQQFVTCLQDKVGASGEPEPVAESAPEPAPAAETAPASAPAEATTPAAPSGSASVPSSAPSSAPSAASRPSAPVQDDDNALDLGATVLPILARTYGPQAAIALVALVVGFLLGRRRR
jgi:carbon monoxide dehydrogenase subunit G